MYKRLNITLPDDILTRADEFAVRERYTRSGLIAAALEAFTTAGPADRVAEAPTTYATASTVPAGAPSIGGVAPLLGAFFSAREDIVAAWVFGSVARGEATAGSDVDVAILPARGLAPMERKDLTFAVMDRLGSVLRRNRVDVVSLPDAALRLALRIVVDGVLVFGEDRREVAEAELAAVRAYSDFKPVVDDADRLVREVVAGYARL